MPQPNPDTKYHAAGEPDAYANDHAAGESDTIDNTATDHADANTNAIGERNGDTETYPNAKTSADTASSAVS